MEDIEAIKINLENEDIEYYEYFQKIKKQLDTNGKNEFSFGKGKVLMAGENFIYKKEDGKKIYFFKNSRILFFSNKEKKIIKKPYFIHDEKSFNDALKNTCIKNGILTDGNESQNDKKNTNDENDLKSNESQSSSSSIESLDVNDILKTSHNYIEEPEQIHIKEILSETNFIQRFNCDKIANLDFNFKYLKENYVKNAIDYIEAQNKWYEELIQIKLNKEKAYCFLFGPKGIGKTTLLLKYLNYEEIPRLYFSLKLMTKPNNFNNKKWKKIALFETIYTFNQIEEMTNFSDTNLDDINDTSNLMEFIYSYIKYIFDFYSKNNIKKKIFVIIDDYNQELFDKDNIIEKIINFIQDKKRNLFLFIIGQGQYINKKLYQYLTNRNEDFLGVYWNLSIENETTKNNNILKLPCYYYAYKNLLTKINVNDTIEKNILNEFKQIKLKSFFILNKFKNIFINIKELKDEFINIPFEFLVIEKNKDIDDNIMIRFKFNLEYYQKIFDDSIKGLLKIDNLMNKMELFKAENTGKDGIDFEDLIVEQLWNNTFDFINFPENNKLKVKEIYSLKNDINDCQENIIISKPIIIRQTIFKGKYYDLLIVIEQNGKIFAVFIQIGLNKTGNEINIYLNNLIKYSKQYEKGIKKFLNIEKEEQEINIGFLLIFDFEHQKKILEKNSKSSGVGYCLENNIDFLIYKDFKLFKNIDDSNPIKNFEITDKTLIFEYEDIKINSVIDIIREKFTELCSTISIDKNTNQILSLTEKEMNSILNYIKNEYKQEFSDLNLIINIAKDFEGFSNFGIIDTDNFNQINVFYNENSKYFFYNNAYHIINGETIKKVDMNKNNKKKYNWDLYLLKKKRKRNL